MALIELVHLKKSFEDHEVLKDMDLRIEKGEFLTLLGPSGCGKTTTLRIIGGVEMPDSGQVIFQGKDITHLAAHLRPVNTLFQQYSLFPHLNVGDNVAFGLHLKGEKGPKVAQRVRAILKLVNLAGFENRSVDSLSGGQKQRIAMARALILNPQVFLLDEPLGALDLKLRKEMQIELKKIQKELGITFIYVTHDQEEALTLSDRIVVMNQGEIQQIGTPMDIYNEPKNAFVADFIGESNIVPATMIKDELVHFSGRDFVCVDKGFAENQAVDVVIRPEDIELVSPEKGLLQGVVTSIVFMGVHYEIYVKTSRETYLIHSTAPAQVGQEVGLRVIPFNIHVMSKSGGVHEGI